MKTVLITGASTGIGNTTASYLKTKGYDVIAGVRKEADGAELAAKGIEIALVDVTDASSLEAAAKQLGDRPLAGLVNNAGIALGGALEYVPIADLRRQLEVNVIGLMATTQAMLPALRRGSGRIINIGSVGGRVASPFVGPYNASKFAVEALTDALRQELAPWGIKAVVVEPGSVSTPIWDKAVDQVADARESFGEEALSRYSGALDGIEKLSQRLNKMGIAPEKVAQVVEKALAARRPRARYLVGVDAHLQVAFKALLPTRAMDAATRRLMGL